MHNPHTSQAINDLLGSAVVFSTTINEYMTEQLDDVSGGQVTFPQLRMLKLLALRGRLSVSAVAEFLGVSPAAASKAVDRLVRSGMLERTEARSDRRAVRVYLTPKATALLDDFDRASGEGLREIFGYLSRSQLARLAKTLDELSISIITHEDEARETCFRCGVHFRDKCLLRGTLNRVCYMDLHDTSSLPGHATTETSGMRRPPP